jgi:hypothetical protein
MLFSYGSRQQHIADNTNSGELLAILIAMRMRR